MLEKMYLRARYQLRLDLVMIHLLSLQRNQYGVNHHFLAVGRTVKLTERTIGLGYTKLDDVLRGVPYRITPSVSTGATGLVTSQVARVGGTQFAKTFTKFPTPKIKPQVVTTPFENRTVKDRPRIINQNYGSWNWFTICSDTAWNDMAGI